MLYLRTLGTLALHADGPDGEILLKDSKSLVLLAWLAAAPGRVGRREYIAELLWPNSGLSSGLRSLRQSLYYLSKHGAGNAFQVDDGTLRIVVDHVACDVAEFLAALEAGDLERAVELHQGRFLESFERQAGEELSHWIDAENERLRIGLSATYVQLINQKLDSGDREPALGFARQYAEREPMSEQAQIALIRALRAMGDDNGALQVYERYRKLIAGAVGDEPGDELQESVARIREELLNQPEWPTSVEHRNHVETVVPPAPISELPPVWWQSRTVLAVAALICVLSGGFIWSQFLGRSAHADSVETIHSFSAQLVVRGMGEPNRPIGLAISDGRARAIDAPEAASRHVSVPSPDRSRVAFVQETPNGYDLAVWDQTSHTERTLVADRADEYPLDWSPDGQSLLYATRGFLDDLGDYGYALWVYDFATDDRRRLAVVSSVSEQPGSWSPSGTQIAYAADAPGGTDVFVSGVDGSDPVNLTRHESRDRPIGWSPDGRSILFSSDRDGAWKLFVMAADGTTLRSLADEPSDAVWAVWTAPAVVIASELRGREEVLWAIDPTTRERRRIVVEQKFRSLLPAWSTRADSSWINELVIAGPAKPLRVGQRFPLSVRAITADGNGVNVERRVHWSIEDSSVVSLREDDQDFLQARVVGRTRLTASLGGWRTTSIEVEVRLIQVLDIEPVETEDWKSGIQPDRWRSVGEPEPFARPDGGPEDGGVFINNGDPSYTSGVVSRRSFSAESGLTIEAWGKAPFTGEHWESWQLIIRIDQEGVGHDPFAFRLLDLNLNGHDQTARLGGTAILGISVPFPATPEDWRLYALQVEPSGAVSVLYDGVLQWRELDLIPTEYLNELYIGIGGAANSAEIMHGPLRVYEGLRYGVGDSDGSE